MIQPGKTELLSADVYVTAEDYPMVGRAEMDWLAASVPRSARGRTRLCIHRSGEDRMQEMFISFAANNYVRPSRHLGKDESLHMLHGEADYFFFDEEGRVSEVVPLGTYESGRAFYCHIPAETDHALQIRSDRVDIHEATGGPFHRDDTIFAPWSPGEGDASAALFLRGLEAWPRARRSLLEMRCEGGGDYVSDRRIVSVGKAEIDFLKGRIDPATRQPVRLLVPARSGGVIRETFTVQPASTYIRPARHSQDDLSYHLIEGEADLVFFGEGGEIAAVVPLGGKASGRRFYGRVSAGFYHLLLARSETLVIHGVTPGSFRRSDAAPAPWAPEEADGAGVERFLERVRRDVAAGL